MELGSKGEAQQMEHQIYRLSMNSELGIVGWGYVAEEYLQSNTWMVMCRILHGILLKKNKNMQQRAQRGRLQHALPPLSHFTTNTWCFLQVWKLNTENDNGEYMTQWAVTECTLTFYVNTSTREERFGPHWMAFIMTISLDHFTIQQPSQQITWAYCNTHAIRKAQITANIYFLASPFSSL